MNKVKFVLFVASISLAMAFTFSCSGDSGSSDGNKSCSVVQSDAPSLGGIFEDGNVPWWFSDAAKEKAKNDLFQPGNVVEILPVPKEPSKFSNPDTIKAYYPGSVGTLFEVGHSIYQTAERVMNECTKNYTMRNACYNKNGLPLTQENLADGITLNASVYYHTNLGNYTAHRDKIVANCTDKIFRNEEAKVLNPSYGNNCVGNEYNLYLAWDLKNNCGKFVKAGTYKSTIKFYVQIEYIDAAGDLKSETLYQAEFADKYEVKYE